MKRLFCLMIAGILVALAVPSELYSAKRPDPEYRIQVASYQDLGKAEDHVQTLKQLGHEAFVEKVVVKGKGTWYRVGIGRFKNKETAERAGTDLKGQGIVAYYSVQAHLENTKDRKVRKTADERPAAPLSVKTESSSATNKPTSAPAPKENKPSAPPAGAVSTISATTESTKLKPEESLKKSPQPPPAAPAGAVEKKEPTPVLPAFPKSELFGSAMTDFKVGQYQSALTKLLDVNRENLDLVVKERVLRRIADCHYFIGIKGSNRDLLSAVDVYKEILQKFPNNREENSEAQYRLAKSYLQLKFYYEAKREFQNLYSRYNDSPHTPEALFMTGEMSYRTRNFTDAVSRYKEYLVKFPQGDSIQQAYFGLGDSYSQLQQNDQAEACYAEARKKWQLEDMPKDAILKLGYHYFRSKKYPDAVRMFFFFVNLYPDDEMSRDVLFSIARSFMEVEQYGIALKMFSLLIERYPDSREAQESAIIMANIGVKKPSLKVPDLPGMQNYRDPLKVYDSMLAQTGPSEMAEGLLYQKGYALWKYGRYEESFEAFSQMIRLFPQARYKEEGIKNLILDINELVAKYNAQRDYLSVARMYYKIPENVLNRNSDHGAVFGIGDALRKIGLFFDAKRVFENLLQSMPPGQDKSPVLLALADIENRRGRPDDAERILQDVSSDKSRSNRNVLVSIYWLRGDIALRRGQYEKAVSAYAETLSHGEPSENAAVFFRNYATALKESNACAPALVQYQKAMELYQKGVKENQPYPRDVWVTACQGMGECYTRQNKHQEAVAMYKQSITGTPGSRENLWALFDMGRGYIKASSPAMAEKVFSELKSRGGEEFWANVIDYTVRDNAWMEKYAKYLR